MNTIRSTAYGWGVLILAGGGAYYFAKKDINAGRAEKAAADRRTRERNARLETQAMVGDHANGGANPSQEASQDPAPTQHTPETVGQQTFEKSKYEASDPFRSKKGDRFS